MAKVEGSNPFIRFPVRPEKEDDEGCPVAATEAPGNPPPMVEPTGNVGP